MTRTEAQYLALQQGDRVWVEAAEGAPTVDASGPHLDHEVDAVLEV